MIDVLLVDDDFDIRDTVREVLGDYGYSVALAADGGEALDWLRQNPAPALILLDWMMPNVDGATFRNTQLAEQAIASIPVVLITADMHIDDKKKVLHADGYLKKPVELATLLEVVKKFVGR